MPIAHRADQRLPGRDSIRPRVLLVMDDDELRATFAYELTASGFDVAVAETAAAPRRSTDNPPDLIITTLSTELGAGRAAAATPAEAPWMRAVPVVGVVKDGSTATRDLARRLGCAAVCLTTCTGDVLASGLRAVLAGSRTIQ